MVSHIILSVSKNANLMSQADRSQVCRGWAEWEMWEGLGRRRLKPLRTVISTSRQLLNENL